MDDDTTIPDPADTLDTRVAALGAVGRALSRDAMLADVAAIRLAAETSGILPAVAVARALERAIARGDGDRLVRGWIALLREAVDSGRRDSAASQTFLAAGAIRFG